MTIHRESALFELERNPGIRLAQSAGSGSHRRLILLGLEAVRRDVISRRKYIELIQLTGLTPAIAEELANQLLADELDEPHDILDYDE